jgi:hypothetical protein
LIDVTSNNFGLLYVPLALRYVLEASILNWLRFFGETGPYTNSNSTQRKIHTLATEAVW